MPQHASLQRLIGIWLFVCAALVWATLVVGGVTRLTHSGLSIVEWQPVVGALPPMGEGEWQATFARYRQTPEYRLVNAGMSLGEFKAIFWWEYGHRLLGRVDGLVFALPLLLFWRRGGIGRKRGLKLLGILLLGAAQGAMGWYMVKSGLVDDPRVSQYRLAAHLALAFGLFGALLWMGLDAMWPRARNIGDEGLARLRHGAAWLAAAVAAQAMGGAIVAGIHAGKAYNSFPLMAGHLVPPELWMLDPWYSNVFNNPATVQFDHRLGAWLLAVLVPWFAQRAWRATENRRARGAALLSVVLFAVQVALGIATLLLAVPVALGAAHQACAMLLFGALLWLAHELRMQGLARVPMPQMKMAAP